MSPCANVCQFVSSNRFLFPEKATFFWLSFSWRNHALVKNQESFINEQTIPTCIISHSFRALGAEIFIAFAYQLRYSNMSDAGEMLVPLWNVYKDKGEQTKTSVCKSILAKCAATTNFLRLPRRIHILFNRLTHLDKRNAGVSGKRRLSYGDKLVSKKCGECFTSTNSPESQEARHILWVWPPLPRMPVTTGIIPFFGRESL